MRCAFINRLSLSKKQSKAPLLYTPRRLDKNALSSDEAVL